MSPDKFDTRSLYLYMLVVQTFHSDRLGYKTYLMLGWGVPLPLTVTWIALKGALAANSAASLASAIPVSSAAPVLAADVPPVSASEPDYGDSLSYHLTSSHGSGGNLLRDCPWMEKDYPIDWFHTGPALACVATNIVFLVIIIV
ncbi:unnamed protein product, partial [Cyprideis torosa]